MNSLGRHVPLELAPTQNLIEARPSHELAGQHARGAQRPGHVRHVDHGVPLVVPREEILVVGLEEIVDLFAQALAQLIYERASVKSR